MEFKNVDAVEEWGRANGGEGAVRNLLAQRTHVFRALDLTSPRMLSAWLETHQIRTADERDRAAVEAAIRSARAAEGSARWAGVAAVAAILGGVASVVGAIVPLFTQPSGQQTQLQHAASAQGQEALGTAQRGAMPPLPATKEK